MAWKFDMRILSMRKTYEKNCAEAVLSVLFEDERLAPRLYSFGERTWETVVDLDDALARWAPVVQIRAHGSMFETRWSALFKRCEKIKYVLQVIHTKERPNEYIYSSGVLHIDASYYEDFNAQELFEKNNFLLPPIFSSAHVWSHKELQLRSTSLRKRRFKRGVFEANLPEKLADLPWGFAFSGDLWGLRAHLDELSNDFVVKHLPHDVVMLSVTGDIHDVKKNNKAFEEKRAWLKEKHGHLFLMDPSHFEE